MITLQQAQLQLDAWLKASLDVAQGKTVSISTSGGQRAVSSEDGSEIRKQIIFWQHQVNVLSGQPNKPFATVIFRE